jgi:hypothetical protein
MIGANLTHMDSRTLRLLSNPEVLAVDQHSSGARVAYRDSNVAVWVATPTWMPADILPYSISARPLNRWTSRGPRWGSVHQFRPCVIFGGTRTWDRKVCCGSRWPLTRHSCIACRSDNTYSASGPVARRLINWRQKLLY